MITAKLSREFYERFGDKVVNEMVDLFNRIDQASRSDLERLNEANAARVEPRIDQRSAELLAVIDRRYAELRSEIVSLDARLRVAALESAVASLDARVAAFPGVLEKALHAQTRWMIGALFMLIASQIPLWFR